MNYILTVIWAVKVAVSSVCLEKNESKKMNYLKKIDFHQFFMEWNRLKCALNGLFSAFDIVSIFPLVLS